MEIEMETKSNGSKTPEVNGEGHETDHESCWWSADCDVKVKNRKIRVSVKVMKDKVILRQKKFRVDRILKFENVIGVDHEISRNADDTATKLLFHHYPIKNGKIVKDPIYIIISQSESRDANEETAEKILKYVRGEIYAHRPENLRYLILLNPTSGTGQSLRIYKKFKMLLSQANIGHSLIETEYRGHAAELGQTHDISKYNAVITISGDGLFHELLNGLLKRTDDSLPPVGLIPAGSGNGLAWSAAHLENAPDVVTFAMFKALKYQPKDLDLFKYESGNEVKYCMLSVMVGLIADIDIDSDKLRSLGQLRFTIYSVLRIMTKRSYKIKIDLFDNENNLLSSNTENYWAVCFGVAPYIDRETHIFPKCTNNRGLHMVSLQHNMSRTEFIPFWGHVEAGTHLDQTCPFMDHQKVHRAEISMDSPATVAIDGEPAKVSSFSLTDLPKHIRSLF